MERMRADPALIPRIIGLLDGTGGARSERALFAQCVRKFGQMNQKACILTIEQCIGDLKDNFDGTVFPLEVLKCLVVWVLRVAPNSKIPKSKRLKAQYEQFVQDRIAEFWNVLIKMFVPYYRADQMIFLYGCYVLVKPEQWDDEKFPMDGPAGEVEEIMHRLTGKISLLPKFAKINKASILEWKITNNHDDTTARLENEKTGYSLFLRRLFVEDAVPLPQAVL